MCNNNKHNQFHKIGISKSLALLLYGNILSEMIQLREGDIYRKELVKIKMNLAVESLLKSKKLEKKPVKFDLSPLDQKIFHQVINKKEINLVKDENAYAFLETLWGPFWEVPKTRCNRKGKKFRVVPSLSE